MKKKDLVLNKCSFMENPNKSERKKKVVSFCPRRSVYVEDYNIALIVVVSRCLFAVSTLKNLRTTTQMLMKLGQCYF